MAEDCETLVREPLLGRTRLADLVLGRQAPVPKGASWR
jgi:hypothetical protein